MSSSNKSQMKGVVIGAVIGAVVTLGAYTAFAPSDQASSAGGESSEPAKKKPLYWVAPMDADYKSDKPGKSPMGMELIPYYGNTGAGPDEGKGTIRISPDVINNLGVRTVNAAYQPLHMQIDTVGYVAWDQDALVHIHPRVEGWVEKLYVKAIGDPVKKGQPLYDIYSPELVNAQEELLLALDRSNQRLITAAENRLVSLQIPKSAIIQLKKTKKVQQNITFYAPQQGVVKNLKIREGFFIQPGSTMMSIGDLAEVWVEAEVFERQAGQIKIGTPVTMTLDYLPSKEYNLNVDYIYPTLDPKTRTMKVRIRVDNKNGDFKPDMFAQISLHTSGDESALLIPKEALVRTGHQDRVVLALGQGSFKAIEVNVGRFDRDNVEILSGLAAGEKVVTSAQFLLDSESSKTSDFKRMNHEQASKASMDMAGKDMAGKDMAGKDMTGMDMEGTDHGSMEGMDHGSMADMDHSSMAGKDMKKQIPSAMVNGTVKSVMVAHRMVNVDREAIVDWDRPAANVDYIVSEDVDMTLFTEGAYVMFTFEIREGDFVIVSAMAMAAPEGSVNEQGEGQ
ncbi:efflux RND transporter periplasmic adaptor subunit [Shewanella sp. Actino-trap-3]|uniref:efflux RND transporter periplasmic adaptor subunit n=1 Tax=Shewanella sp. Actino-trap-3 TaxID=2058331 RepID=UPI000C32279F|nr:efflux RND transporter periplasmic adaptor subunit [Shewanella sp. Actino-trap-3]PKG77584.1 efflux RND transporter periplasmic adaptor subunit [Shewanella sp. Actino-trap-3]